MPNKSKAFIQFNDHSKTVLAPYFSSLDTESVLKSNAGPAYQKHEISSYAIALIRTHDKALLNRTLDSVEPLVVT